MKNPNSHGSAYKLKGRRRKPWVARVTIGWSREGKQQRRLLGTFGTKQEALDALACYRFTPISPKANITLSDLYSEWAESKYSTISKSTVDGNRAAWNHIKHLEPKYSGS